MKGCDGPRLLWRMHTKELNWKPRVSYHTVGCITYCRRFNNLNGHNHPMQLTYSNLWLQLENLPLRLLVKSSQLVQLEKKFLAVRQPIIGSFRCCKTDIYVHAPFYKKDLNHSHTPTTIIHSIVHAHSITNPHFFLLCFHYFSTIFGYSWINDCTVGVGPWIFPLSILL